jgi:signal transduction histidine kinase
MAFVPYKIFAQTPIIDSLIKVIKVAKDDTLKAYNLNYLGREIEDNDPEKSIIYYNEALELSQKLGYLRGEGVAKVSIGTQYSKMGKFKEALAYLNEGLEIHRKTGYRKSEAIALQVISFVFLDIGKFPEAIAYQLASLKIKEALGDKKLIISAYLNVSTLYSDQNKNAEALKYINLALKLAKELEDKRLLAYAYNAQGELFAKQNQPKEALFSFERAFELWKSIEFLPGYVGSYLGIAEQQYELGNFSEAEANYLNAINVANTLKDKLGLVDAYNGLGKVLIKEKKYAESKANFEIALTWAKEINYLIKLKEIYEGLSTLEQGQGNYEAALANYKLFEVYKDSIFNDDNKQKLLQAQMQYDFDKEQAVKDEISKEELRVANIQWYSTSAIALLIFLFSLIMLNRFWVIRKQKRIIQVEKERGDELLKLSESQKMELEKLNGVKDRLFSVICHDLRAPVNSLVSFTQLLEGGNVPPEKLARYSLDLNKILDGTSKLLDNLLQWAATQLQGTKPQIEKINLGNLLFNELNHLKPKADEKEIFIQNEIPENLLAKGDSAMTGLILRNLVSNAIKFSQRDSAILINHEIQTGKVRVSITDMGVGITPDLVDEFNQYSSVQPLQTTFGTEKEKGTGLGLMLCKTYAEAMGGSIMLESSPGKGSRFILVLPLV